MNESLPDLSRFELQCLRLIWRLGPASARQVQQALPDPPSYSTIRKILERLEKKQAIERVGKASRSVLYRARVGHAAIVRREIRRFLELMFDGAAVPLLAHLADMKALELEDLRALEQALSAGGASEPEPNEDAE